MVGIDWLRSHHSQETLARGWDEGDPLALGHLAGEVGGGRPPWRQGRRTGEDVSFQLGRLRSLASLDRLGKTRDSGYILQLQCILLLLSQIGHALNEIVLAIRTK